jgi:excisionase family DNA binding protein
MLSQRKPMHAVDSMAPDVGPLLRIEDIAERLSISRSMAWKLIAIGELRSIRIGRSVRVRPQDLDAFVAAAARQD